MKKALFLFFVLFSLFAVPDLVRAQASGGQDSTGADVPALRPRRDTYIIEPFPSPARRGQIVKVQIYNHSEQQLSVRIIDVLGKTIKILQVPKTLPNGIHTYDFQTSLVSTGTYYIRLATFSSTGSESLVQDSRFIVIH